MTVCVRRSLVHDVAPFICYDNMRTPVARARHAHSCANACDRYPPIVSMVVKEVDRHAAELGKAAMYILGHVSLERWAVTADDVEHMQVWLCGPANDPRHTAARHLFSNAGWRNRREGGELVIAPVVQLRAALALTRAYAVYGPKHTHSTFSSELSKLIASSQEEVNFYPLSDPHNHYHTHVCAHRHACIHTHTHTHTHTTHTHSRAHTHTRTHTHAVSPLSSCHAHRCLRRGAGESYSSFGCGTALASPW
jgi:hypothetical protein